VADARAGQEYKFLIVRGNDRVWRPDPRARRMTSSVGNSVIVDPSAYGWKSPSFRTPSFNESVICEMHVGTFNRQSSGKAGDFVKAIEKLDHLAALGINVIEVMPLTEFPAIIRGAKMQLETRDEGRDGMRYSGDIALGPYSAVIETAKSTDEVAVKDRLLALLH
jgi:pullulanase/glycogen debranching enzyme